MSARDAAERLSAATVEWLASLDPGQRARATFPFAAAERFAWGFVPGDRTGLALGGWCKTRLLSG